VKSYAAESLLACRGLLGLELVLATMEHPDAPTPTVTSSSVHRYRSLLTSTWINVDDARMLQELIDNYGPWLLTLKGAAGAAVAGAKKAEELLNSVFEQKADLAPEQEERLKTLPKSASAQQLVDAINGTLHGEGAGTAQAKGGDGGAARSFFGSPTGGSGGDATANAAGHSKSSGK
jgi:hypothetical protein